MKSITTPSLFQLAGMALLLSAAANAAVISNGLVGEYTFESGTSNDSTGLIGNGVNVGAPLYVIGTGRSGTVLTLSENNYVSIATDSDIPSGAAARTVSLWLQVTTSSVNGGPFRYGNPGDTHQDFSLELRDNGNNLGVNHWNDDLDFTVAGIGSWHNITYTYDGTQTQAYVDGILVGTKVVGLNTVTTDGLSFGGPRLGGGDNAGGNFSIDDVLIYNRVLSAAEITTLATTVPEPSAVLLGGLSLAGFLVRRRRA